MLRRTLVVVSILALMSVPAAAGVITFNELGLGVGDILTTQLGSLGVIFSTSLGTTAIGDSTDYPPPGASTITGQYVILGSTDVLVTPAILSVFFVDPSNPVVPRIVDGSTIFIDLWDTESNVTVHAYDDGGSLLGTVTLNTLFANAMGGFTGDVHRLDFVDDGADGFVLDNLVFGDITPVPEPGTLALMGLGLLAVAFGLRRKRA